MLLHLTALHTNQGLVIYEFVVLVCWLWCEACLWELWQCVLLICHGCYLHVLPCLSHANCMWMEHNLLSTKFVADILTVAIMRCLD
eukprot:c1979_g1_i1 orf=44-301(+)